MTDERSDADRTADEKRFLDEAAIAAMSSIIKMDWELDYDQASQMAYEYADEMLKVRRTYDQ